MSRITRTIKLYNYDTYGVVNGAPEKTGTIALDHEIKTSDKKKLGIEMAVLTSETEDLYSMETTDFVMYGTKELKATPETTTDAQA